MMHKSNFTKDLQKFLNNHANIDNAMELNVSFEPMIIDGKKRVIITSIDWKPKVINTA